MGFTITSSYPLPGTNRSLTNLYVTVHAHASSDKNKMHIGNNESYILISRYLIYGDKNDTRALYERQITIPIESLEVNLVAVIYTYLKEVVFNGATMVDDL